MTSVVRSEANLAQLSRREIQQLAKDAGIKANKSTDELIQMLCVKNTTPKPMKSGRRVLGEISASKANRSNVRSTPLSKVTEESQWDGSLASPIAPGSFLKQSPDRLVFSPGSTCHLDYSCESGGSPAQFEEMNTIELTVARLRELGFPEEEARWAADEARARENLQCSKSVSMLSLDLSRLSIMDETDKVDHAESGTLCREVLSHVLSRLNTWTLTRVCVGVNSTWRDESINVLRNYPNVNAMDNVDDIYTGTMDLRPPLRVPPAAFAQKFPWVRFLAAGGFKQVFLGWNSSERRREAISVMDLGAMSETRNLCVADTEIRIAFLLESLRESEPLGCEHFVRTFQMFRCDTPPPAYWGNEENKQPLGSLQKFLQTDQVPIKQGGRRKQAVGDYQYIRMEFCTEGDLEETLRNHPCPPTKVVKDLLRQMTISLEFCQKLWLRHYDIKLLNFFLTVVALPVHHVLEICNSKAGIEGNEHPPCTEKFWEEYGSHLVVKLADFGTADVDLSVVDSPFTERQVTTWENVLPEFLLFGDKCKQGFQSDMHGLALCFLHLLIGDCPYEEALSELVCPQVLAAQWRQIWMNSSSREKGRRTVGKLPNRYAHVANLIEDDMDDTTLQDTLYRNIILFQPECVDKRHMNDSPVLGALRDWVQDAEGKNIWEKEVAMFSVMTADKKKVESISRAQHVLWTIRNGAELLRGMTDFCGAQRLTYSQVLNLLAS